MFDQDIEKTSEAASFTFPSLHGSKDPDYLYRRAEQELELAQAATNPAVVKAHYLLADRYLESLYGIESEAAPA